MSIQQTATKGLFCQDLLYETGTPPPPKTNPRSNQSRFKIKEKRCTDNWAQKPRLLWPGSKKMCALSLAWKPRAAVFPCFISMSNTALRSICGTTQKTHRHWAKAFAALAGAACLASRSNAYRCLSSDCNLWLHNAFLMEQSSCKKYECQHSPCFHQNDKGSKGGSKGFWFWSAALTFAWTVSQRSSRWADPIHSSSLFFDPLPPFLHPLVPIQLRLNYGLLNKAATNALPCSPLLAISPFLSYWSSAWKELAKLLCPRHQLAATQAPLDNIDMSQTLGKLALLEDHTHTHTHTQHWLPCMYYQWQWPI